MKKDRMNYIYKDKLYTIRKIDIKDFTQFEGKWYPTVFYENEEGLRFNSSVKEFFDKFEMYRELDFSNIDKLMKGHSSLHVDSKLRHIDKSEPILYSTPKSEIVEKSPQEVEHRDFLSLVLGKMPFLAGEKFSLSILEDDHGAYVSIRQPYDEPYHLYENHFNDEAISNVKSYYRIED